METFLFKSHKKQITVECDVLVSCKHFYAFDFIISSIYNIIDIFIQGDITYNI